MADIDFQPEGGGIDFQPDFQPDAKPESASFFDNLKAEAKAGLRQTIQPGSEEYLGSRQISDLPVVGNAPRNAIGSLLGLAKTIYAVPNAAAKTFVGDPLDASAAPYTPERLAQMKRDEPGLYDAIRQLSPEQQVEGQKRSARIAEGLAGLGLSMGGAALANSPNFLIRLFGKTLDPLASSTPGALNKTREALQGRVNQIGQLQGDIGKTEGRIGELQQTLKPAQGAVDDIERQMAELKAATLESKEAKLAQTERIPPQPTAPEVQGIPGAAANNEVGAAFKGEVLPGAREALYGESTQRYDALRQAGEQIPLPSGVLDEVGQTIDRLAGESRLPKTTGTVAEQLQMDRPAGNVAQIGETPGHLQLQNAAQTFRELNPAQMEALVAQGLKGKDLMEVVQAGLQGEGANMANAMRADQILSSASRQFQRVGDLASRSAVEELRQPILRALEGSPLAEGLVQAKSLHRETAELVGPRSLAERVFRTKPEQVVDNIFLPQGRGNPNVSLIGDARAIYQKVAPGEWPKVTASALAKLQERSVGATGQIDPQRFLRNWRSYRSTFEAALEPASFRAVDSIAQEVQRFNQSRRVYQGQLDLAKREAASMREFYARQSAQLQVKSGRLGLQRADAVQGVKAIEDQINEANTLLGKLQKDLTQTQTFGLKSGNAAIQTAMSPHMMIALAQLGQALQATFTGNLAGAGRQLMQGLVWATLGNPLWLQRLAGNPQLAKAVDTAIQVQKGARLSIDGARLLTAATKAVGDEIYKESKPE